VLVISDERMQNTPSQLLKPTPCFLPISSSKIEERTFHDLFSLPESPQSRAGIPAVPLVALSQPFFKQQS
jgi:hypothetical protein